MRRPLAWASSLILWAWMALPHAQTPSLPDIGDPAHAQLSSSEEAELGREVMQRIRRELPLIEDPESLAYLDDLGQRLARPLGGRFTFFIVNAPSINAFALPGGYIGVHTGLILAAENESELAAVLAHEIAHVSQHHLARTLEAQRRMGLPALAALVAALALGTQSPELGQAALAVTTAGQIQHQINFTRAHEMEADRVGMEILEASGFAPESMPRFFERLQQNLRLTGTHKVPEFLSTHPVTSRRIAEARARAAQAPPGKKDSLAFHLFRARIRVLASEDPREAAEAFEKALKAPYPEALRYGRALALLKAGEPGRAKALAEALARKDPSRLPYLLLEAESEWALGEREKALAHYQEALQWYPQSEALVLAYAEALLKAGQGQKAARLLKEQVHRHPSPGAYQLLARAYQQLGLREDTHLALAESYALEGDIPSAIAHLELALKEPLDFYHRARIEARLAALKKARILDKKGR
ncbi:MAG: M48 family peptidase [Gammaproteobacteria bacterium]|nr:MAG: M48 family peptidase [Gammaproteobacteria bacterium]